MQSSSVIGFVLSACYPEDFLFTLAGWLVGCLGNYGDSIPQKVGREQGFARLIVSKWSMSAKLAV